jgi:hypothetical protein
MNYFNKPLHFTFYPPSLRLWSRFSKVLFDTGSLFDAQIVGRVNFGQAIVP